MPPITPTPSITTWTRLEPRSRNAEMQTSLQARLYDPLWLLGRQWQLGEFRGEDAGSPVAARWRGESAPLTRYLPGRRDQNAAARAHPYDRHVPLEAVVEREHVRRGVEAAAGEGLRFAAESGQHFLRLLARQPLSADYRDAMRRAFPFPALTDAQRTAIDRDSLAFLDVVGPRVPDGRRLYAAFRPPGQPQVVLPADLEIDDRDVAEVEKAAAAWIAWCDAFLSEPAAAPSAWLADRLEYAFAVSGRFADGELVLTADEYASGHLDWHAFDLDAGGSLGATVEGTPVVRTVVPAPVSFRGMPSPRLWELEDAQVDFGSVDAGPTDLGRLLLVEFALVYGNDWFVIPIDLDVGAIHRTRSLVITDTFGVRTLLRSSSELGPPHSTWRMFELSGTAASPPPGAAVFLLPPSLLSSLESRPLEEVLFLRDEMANMAWGLERLVEGAAEQPVNRFDEYVQALRRATPVAGTEPPLPPGVLRYRLATTVPDYWIPLLPVRTASGLRLQRGGVLGLDGSAHRTAARGQILSPRPGEPLQLFEEEVPREGARVRRSYQYARWIDGSTHLWIGRRKHPGRGEGSSGLRFDSLEGEPSA